MNSYRYFIIVFPLLFINIISKNLKAQLKDDKDKLLFVWKHFRHGARGPYIAVNLKTHLDFIGETWNTMGELTPLGLRMHYLLGVSTKNDYSNFISEKYNPNELYITSTNVNRTLVSVYAFLKGFYGNDSSVDLSKKQIERGNILNSNYSVKIKDKIEKLGKKSLEGGVSEIPVHIFNRNKLEFGLYEGANCPGIIKYQTENQESERVKKVYEDIKRHTNETFGKYILKFMNTTDLNYLWNKTNIYYLSDTFFSDYFNGREMKYINETGIDMESFYQNSFNVTFIDTYHYTFGFPSTDTVYISVSPMLRNILHYMDLRVQLDKQNKPDEIIADSPRFVIFSGHDTSLAPIDIFMESEFGIEFGMATYASSQTFELWKNATTGKYSVHYLFNQELKGNFELDYFREKLENKTYNQEKIREICFPNLKNYFSLSQSLNRNNANLNLNKILIYISITSIAFILISGLIFKFSKRNKEIRNDINFIDYYI